MRSRWLVLIVPLFALAFARADSAESSNAQTSYGFFIGINGTHLGANRLRYAANDAMAFAWRYVEELALIPAKNTWLILDGKVLPDSEEEDHLEWFIQNGAHVITNGTAKSVEVSWQQLTQEAGRKLQKGSLFIVFISSHGNEKDGIPRLVAPPNPEDKNEFVSLQKIGFEMAQLNNLALRLLLIDACRTEPGKSDLRDDLSARFISALSKTQGWLIFSSCSSGERSYESDRLKHGVFTSSFLEASRGAKDVGASEIINLASIIDKVSKSSSDLAFEEHGDGQHPFILGEGQATAVPVGISPFARSIIRMHASRVKLAESRLDEFEKQRQLSSDLLQTMRFTLRSRSEDRQKILVPRIETLPKSLSASDVVRLQKWWKRFMESEIAGKKRELPVPKGAPVRSSIGAYVLCENQSKEKCDLGQQVLAALKKEADLTITELGEETVARIDETISPPKNLFLKSDRVDGMPTAYHQSPSATSIALNAGEGCSHVLRISIQGTFRSLKARFATNKREQFVYTVRWTLVSRIDGKATTKEFSGEATDPTEKNIGDAPGNRRGAVNPKEFPKEPRTGKSDLALWQGLSSDVQTKVISQIVENLRTSLRPYLRPAP